MSELVWSYTHVETAMCLYEYATDIWNNQYWDKEKKRTTEDAPQWIKDLDDAWDSNGSFGMKHAIAHLAFEVQQIWEAIDGPDRSGADGIIFDDEFIPQVLPLVDWLGIESDQRAKMKPGAQEELTAWVAAEKHRQDVSAFNQFYPTMEAYKAALEKEAGRQWGFPGLITEGYADAYLDDGFKNRTHPHELVQTVGKESDLDEPDPMTKASLARIYR